MPLPIQMLALVLLAIQCHGLIEDSRFKVTKCSTDDGQTELTFTIEKDYFEQYLSWQADQEGIAVLIRSALTVERSQFQILKSLR